MMKESFYSILNLFGFSAGFYILKLNLNPGDEMVDSTTSSNCFFKGVIQPPSAFFGTS